MHKVNAWLIILAGVLLWLNAAEVIDIVSGAWSWVLAVVVLLIGIGKLMMKK